VAEQSRRRAFTLVELIMVLAIVALLVVITVPNVIESRKHANHGAAVGGLKTIIVSEALFREQDREQDQNFDYGTLREMSDVGVLEPIIARGRQSGYDFEVAYSTITSEFLWFGLANPAVPAGTGDLYFATNQRGVIFYSFTTSVVMNDTDCVVPPNFIPVYSR